MRSLLLIRSPWHLPIWAILLLALTSASLAEATPAAMAGLLRNVERDVGAMAEQVSVMRGRLAEAAGGEGPGARIVGIADGGFVSTMRSLHQAALRLERRLAELRPRLRQLDEAKAGEIMLAMRVELSALTLALGDLAATDDRAVRAEALDQLGTALMALDGATAAVWTLDTAGRPEPASDLAASFEARLIPGR